jgi:hypothetical protein
MPSWSKKRSCKVDRVDPSNIDHNFNLISPIFLFRHFLTSTSDVLKIPKRMEFAEPISPGSVLPPSEVVRVVVDGKEFEITDSQTTLLASGKLWETEDGSYVLPDEWNVHPSQFSALFDLLHSKTK